MKSFALFLFGLAAAAIVIGCKNPSSGSDTDTTPYTVTYNLNGGTGATAPTDANTYTVGQDVTAAAKPGGLTAPPGTPLNHRFIYWNTKADGSGTDVAVGTGTIPMPSGGLTLYAKWVDTYTVAYNPNGGTGTAPTDSERYASGQEVTAAAAPAGLTAPTDKKFDGWNTQADGSGTDVAAGGTIKMPSGELTLYAKWADTTYTVTYNLNGGTGAEAPTDANTYASDAEVTAAAEPAGLTAPADKRFDGWNTQADGSGTDVAAGTGTIRMPSGGGLILYAKWADIRYSVTYDANTGGGTVPTDANTYTVGQTVTPKAMGGLTAPADKRFDGWNTESDGSGTDAAAGGTIAMISGGLTLYAKWVDTYTVTYDANGGTGTVPTDSVRYASGEDVTAAAAPAGLTAPADKRFAGWNTRADGSGTDAAAGGTIAMISGGLTLYAKWVDTYYTVTYDANGGTGTVPTDGNRYAAGASVTAATAPAGLTAPADKTFAGWNTESDGSGTDVAAGTGTIEMPSGGGLILYAKWVDRTYTATYNLNGGTGTAPTDANTYAAGASVTAKAAPAGLTAPADKRFDGWNTESDGSGTDVAAGTGTIAMPSGGGLILYAKWVDRTYTVTYNLNGGTGATAPTDANTYTAGQVVTAAVAPTGLVPPTGKTFDGWNTEADGSGTDVTAGGTGTIAMPSGGGLILYAKWSN